MTQRTWQDNAAEFGALTRQGKDVRLALLVACSVEKRNGGPRTVANATVRKKVSAREFAEFAGTSPDRVLRHLRVWERMAKNGAVPSASGMQPGDALDFGEVIEAVQDEFAEAFAEETGEKPSGGRPRDSRPENAATIIQRHGPKAVLDTMTEEQRGELAREAMRSAPRATKAQVVAESVAEDDEIADAAEKVLDEKAVSETTRQIVREHDRQRAEDHDTDMRSFDYGVTLLAKGRLITQEMAEYGHVGVLREFATYVTGMAEASEADTLTPEMFQ